VLDVLHKGVYALATGLLADTLVAERQRPLPRAHQPRPHEWDGPAPSWGSRASSPPRLVGRRITRSSAWLDSPVYLAPAS